MVQFLAHSVLFRSSVATGGHKGVRPLPSTGMATGFVQIRDFFFGGDGDSSPQTS